MFLLPSFGPPLPKLPGAGLELTQLSGLADFSSRLM